MTGTDAQVEPEPDANITKVTRVAEAMGAGTVPNGKLRKVVGDGDEPCSVQEKEFVEVVKAPSEQGSLAPPGTAVDQSFDSDGGEMESLLPSSLPDNDESPSTPVPALPPAPSSSKRQTANELLSIPAELARQVTPRIKGSIAPKPPLPPPGRLPSLDDSEGDAPGLDGSPPSYPVSAKRGPTTKPPPSGSHPPRPPGGRNRSSASSGRVSTLLYHSVKGGGPVGSGSRATSPVGAIDTFGAGEGDSPSLSPSYGTGGGTNPSLITSAQGPARSSRIDNPHTSSLIGGTISLVPAPATPGGASNPGDVANAAAALSHVKIEEGSPAYYALQANQDVKVGKIDKFARKINAQSLRRAAKRASLRVGFGNRRGKPPRIPVRGQEDREGAGGEPVTMSLPTELGRVVEEEEDEYMSGENVELVMAPEGEPKSMTAAKLAAAGADFAEHAYSAPPGVVSGEVMIESLEEQDDVIVLEPKYSAGSEGLDDTVRASGRTGSRSIILDEEKEEIVPADDEKDAEGLVRSSGSFEVVATAGAGATATFAVADKQGVVPEEVPITEASPDRSPSMERQDSEMKKAPIGAAAAAVAAGAAAAAAFGAAVTGMKGAAGGGANEVASPPTAAVATTGEGEGDIAATAAAATTTTASADVSKEKPGKSKRKKKKDKDARSANEITATEAGIEEPSSHVTFAAPEKEGGKSAKDGGKMGKSLKIKKKKKKDKQDDEEIDFAGLLTERRWKKRKKHQAKKDARKSYVKGKVIDREHELYTLSIAVMLGLRTSIAMTNGQLGQSGAAKAGGLTEEQTKSLSESELQTTQEGKCPTGCGDREGKQHHEGKRWLDGDDFMSVEKYVFRPKGSANTPPHQLSHTFKFKDYSPLAFAYIRRMFGVNEYEFLLSVCGNANFIEFISNAKSGQFFFYSNDGKYMIKTMTNAESKFLRRILPHYFRHCAQNPNTLVTKFLGMYRVKLYHLRRNVKFVIMNSVFDTDKFLQSFFDLKGSVTGRDARPGEAVKKDNDVRRGMPDSAFALPPSVRQKMREQVVRDCDFLREMKIMDYSMLVGVHHIPWRHGGAGMGPSSAPPGSVERGVSFRDHTGRQSHGGSGGQGADRSSLLRNHQVASSPALMRIENCILTDSGNGGQDMAGAMLGVINARTGGAMDSSGSVGSAAAGSTSRQPPSPAFRPAPDTTSGSVGHDAGSGTPVTTQPSHRRAFDSITSLPEGVAGSLADPPSVASYSTIDHYFDEDDDYSYLEGAYSRRRMGSEVDDGANFGMGPSSMLYGATGEEELYPRQPPDALEIKKEEATEQMYWPFHRLYDIYGQRRWLPLMVPEAGEEGGGIDSAEEGNNTRDEERTELIANTGSTAVDPPARQETQSSSLEMMKRICCPPPDERMGQEGNTKWPLKNFEPPVSNRKDGGLMMDVTGLELPLKLSAGGGPGSKTRPYEGKIFYMGIIDVLQQFNIRKRFEAKYRRMRGGGWQDASCVHPDLYAERFIRFFDEYSQRHGPPNKEVELSEHENDDEEGVEEVVFHKNEEELSASEWSSKSKSTSEGVSGHDANGAPDVMSETKKTK